MTTNEIYNQARIENEGSVLCKEELKCALKGMPCLSSFDLIIAGLIKHNALFRVAKGLYKFPDYPIHKNVLDTVYETVKSKQKEYSKRYHDKKAGKESKVEEAIKLLLATGEYEIYKISVIKKKL